MSRKKKILVAIILLVLLLLLILLVWFLNQKTSSPTVVVVDEKPAVAVTTRGQVEEKIVEPPSPEVKDIDVGLQSLAITFAERYGSYSTESDFANLYDVMNLMTATFKKQTEDFIASASQTSTFFGVSTRVLSVKVVSSDETSALVEVSTQRDEAKGGPQASELKYQILSLDCLKEDGVWKVAKAIWQ